MRSKVIFMALFALAFQASARPIFSFEAESVALGWAARGTGSRLIVEKSAEHVVAGEARFFAVKLYGRGTVFTSGDTDVEPIIAYTSSLEDFSTIDTRSPLWALLSRDAVSRMQTGIPSVKAADGAAGAASRWSRLMAAGSASGARLMLGADGAAPRTGLPDDLRVGKLVQSKWDQTTAGGKNCYNYYTPNNYYCGCVATALGQLLRYHHGPVGNGGRGIPLPRSTVEALTMKCSVDGAARNLTMQGGTYEWDKMPLAPGTSGTTEEQRKAIGKLLSDIGIAQHMGYASGGSYSYTPEHAWTLLNVFGYKQAVAASTTDVSGDNSIVRKALFANFDAGYPVTLSINGTAGGHSIVADGYGYEGTVPYVHLNMGWSGSGDMWYNLPDMKKSGFDSINAVVYNVFPTEGAMSGTGAAQAAILSGRVLDDEGAPVADCGVQVFRHGETAPVFSGKSSSTGVWAAVLPAGSYDVVAATDDGAWLGELEGVALQAPDARYQDWVNCKIPVVKSGAIGNSWGNDVMLANPTVRIVESEETFSSLEKALARAGEIAAETPGTALTLELLKPTALTRQVEIGFSCQIRSTGDDPAAVAVQRAAAGGFVVTAGGSLSLSGVVFEGGQGAVVDVKADGRVRLSGSLRFGLPVDIAAVRTEDADGLILDSAIAEGFTVDCAAALDVGRTFGRATCPYADIAEFAGRLVNIHDEYGEIRGLAVDEGDSVRLEWGEVPVPLEDAVGYYEDAAGEIHTAARLDRLLEKFENAQAGGLLASFPELVLCEMPNMRLTRPLVVESDMSIRGIGDVVLSDIAGTAGFVVKGGTLRVNGLAFEHYRGNGLFVVDGGALELGEQVLLSDIEGTNYHSGAVAVLKGSAEVTGAVFENCRASGRGDVLASARTSNGGAIYVGAGAELTLDGGMITGCYANGSGGGIYAYRGSTVSIGGALTVKGNASKTSSPNADDIYVYNRTVTFTLDKGLSGGSDSVGVRYAGVVAGNKIGDSFITVNSAYFDHAPEEELLNSLDAFFNDANPAYHAADDVSGALETFVWTENELEYKCQPGQEDMAVVRISGRGEKVDGYYWNIEHAFEAMAGGTGSATVELLKDTTFGNDLMISGSVSFSSVGGKTLTRQDGAMIIVSAGATLSLANVTLGGGTGANRLLDVNGGELTMKSGATIRDVAGSRTRASGAVLVRNHGSFTMERGAQIENCGNAFTDEGSGAGYGGAVLADHSTVRLQGGSISGCRAYTAGGVFIANESTLYVSGDIRVSGNWNLSDEEDNLRVSDDSRLLRLTGLLDGAIGYGDAALSAQTDVRVFGEVDFTPGASDLAALVESAHRFTRDDGSDIGMVVTDGSRYLLVWSRSLDKDGRFEDEEGTVYELVEGDPYLVDPPVPVTEFTYDGTEKVCIPEGAGYTVTGNVGTNAGHYTAAVAVSKGFAWSTGDDFTCDWEIKKATVNMSGVDFSDLTVDYDGLPKAISVTGELPAGVAVSYEPTNEFVAVGEHLVTARFSAEDPDNYEIADADKVKTATLTIAEPTPPPPPVPRYDTNTPVAIAFQAIERVSATEWHLEITNIVPKCEYRLLFTDDLMVGFPATDKGWFRAADDAEPTWKTNVVFAAESLPSSYFWKAEGRQTIDERKEGE